MKKTLPRRVLLPVLCILTLASVSLANLMYTLIKMDKADRQKDGGKIYISILYEFNPLELPDTEATIQSFNTLYEDLHNEGLYEYYEINSQPLDVEPGYGPLYDYYTGEPSEDYQRVSCVQISQNVQDDFGFCVEEGRLLNSGDFELLRGETIPVLLGAGYDGIFELGDTFTAGYLFSTYSFEVVGFLRDGCEIALSRGTYHLDDRIVMPSFQFGYMPETGLEFVTQKIHDANKLCGKLGIEPADYEEAAAYAQSVLDDAGLGEFSWTSSSTIESMSRKGIDVQALLPVFIVFSLLFQAGLVLCGRKMHIPRGIWKEALYILGTLLLGEVVSGCLVLCVSVPTLGMLYFSSWSLYVSAALLLTGTAAAAALERKNKAKGASR